MDADLVNVKHRVAAGKQKEIRESLINPFP